MEAEVEQLRSLVDDLLMRVESLENRVSELESEPIAGPEPIITCVQCLAEYKESENAEGHCKFHTGTLRYGGGEATYTCCNKSAGNREMAMSVPGCSKGKHRSRHHTDYVYSHYYFHMMDLSQEAEEMWLQMDVKDLVTDSCEWAEVGLSSGGDVFVIVGSTRVQYVTYVELSMRELRQCKQPACVLFEKADPAGWCLKAELFADSHTAKAITVSLRAAGYKSPLVKRLQLVLSGEAFRPGSVETLSDPTPPPVCVECDEGEVVREGPVLESGEDLSKGRKTDYPTITNDDMFALELRQVGGVTVKSSRRTKSGKWNNLFLMDIRLSYGLPGSVSVCKVLGEFMNSDGEWVECDGVRVRPSEGEGFLERMDFLVDGVAPLSMTMQLAIGIDGPEPDSWAAGKRAHHTLPQPLHLRLTCVDELGRTASLRVEQGNPPLSLPTLELRTKNWTRGNALLFYIFADDVNIFKRSDAAIYHDENGMTVFRPAPNDEGSNLFFLRDDMFQRAAYRAQKSNLSEVELTSLKKENKGSSVRAFALVQQGIAYGLKVVVTTPTSKAEGVYILPRDDFSTASLRVDSAVVTINSDFVVSWTVPRASKNDRIELFPEYGKKGLSREYNRRSLTQGDCEMKAPLSPGRYELRYYPKWLAGTYTGLRHDKCVATTPLNVSPA